MQSYSTNPAKDADRYWAAQAWGQSLQEARANNHIEDTMAMVRRGDFSRIYEAMDNDDNAQRAIFEAVRDAALNGNEQCFKALGLAAQVSAEIHTRN